MKEKVETEGREGKLKELWRKKKRVRKRTEENQERGRERVRR